MGYQRSNRRKGTYTRGIKYPTYVTDRFLEQLESVYPPRKPSILELEPGDYDDPFKQLAVLIKNPFMAASVKALVNVYIERALDTTTLLLTAGEPKQPPQRQYVPQPASATSYRPMFVGTGAAA